MKDNRICYKFVMEWRSSIIIKLLLLLNYTESAYINSSCHICQFIEEQNEWNYTFCAVKQIGRYTVEALPRFTESGVHTAILRAR